MLGGQPEGGGGPAASVTTPREEEGPMSYPTARAGE